MIVSAKKCKHPEFSNHYLQAKWALYQAKVSTYAMRCESAPSLATGYVPKKA